MIAHDDASRGIELHLAAREDVELLDDLVRLGALREMEVACRLAPDKAAYQTTLGIAQYRRTRYAEAAKTLKQADSLNVAAEGTSTPADWPP